jgi:nicotinate (nicotinamide) nucleotide adenylyltransferase
LPARPRRILPVIIASQFAGTSLWFAGNAVLEDLRRQWGLAPDALGHITSAVQLGFIAGTLVFAFFALADLFSPRVVFFLCSAAGAIANVSILAFGESFAALLVLRFITGFFLAGIYPVGMKIASGWYQRDLGNALGFLVGALVVGTAFPHLLKGAAHALPWQHVLIGVSAVALAGGVLMLALVPDGPYLARAARFDPRALRSVFRVPAFRASSFGYFGHMWELYAFWAFVPWALAAHPALNVPLWSFAVIAAGALGCVLGGMASLRVGSAPVAFWQLAASGLCCLASPLLFHAPAPLFVAFLLFWGVVVVGDSAQFSALNAHSAPRQLVGSALTIANCIGFAITIFSIQLLSWAAQALAPQWLFVLLTPGPLLGLAALMPLMRPVKRRRVPKIGVLGGTFDPVHNAHLAMARAALEHLKLDKVLFIPTGTTRYRNPALASGEQRTEMLRLALKDNDDFSIDTRELEPGASGYTVETLQALRAELGEAEIYLLLGADQFEKLSTWHRPDEIRRLAKIAVFPRPGTQLKENVELIPMQPMPVSASEIRSRARNGAPLEHLVAPAVANYIAARGLYS